MKAYKVVKVSNGRFFSSCATYPVEYFIGEDSFPVNDFGPLCVFKGPGTAKEFMKKLVPDMTPGRKTEYKVFACEAEESEHGQIWSKYTMIDKVLLPDGTVLADSVKLISEVR